MLVSLQNALLAELQASFPEVYAGDPAPAVLAFAPYEYSFDASSEDPVAGQPTQDDAVDVLPFDPAVPAGPYLLTRPPYPAARRVYLRNADGDRQVLTPGEVTWDQMDARVFTLAPRSTRDLAAFDRVEVLYGVTAVFARLESAHSVVVAITAVDEATAERAESLLLAMLALRRDALLAASGYTESSGGYTANGVVKGLKLRRGSVSSSVTRTLVVEAEVELKLSRALADDEGSPIERITSPGAVVGPGKVNIDIGVQS